jgi:hypothetical protein
VFKTLELVILAEHDPGGFALHSQYLTSRAVVTDPVFGLFSPFWRIFDLLS